MNFLQQSFRGWIRLGSQAEKPDVVYDGPEGPASTLDRIRTYGIGRIRNAVEGHGTVASCLRWEELDLEARVVRRQQTPFEDRLGFRATPDKPGFELILPGVDQQPWVPLQPFAEPAAGQPAVGWSVPRDQPTLAWRYLQGGGESISLEVTWSFAGLYRSWVQAVLGRVGELRCQVDTVDCSLKSSRDEQLVYRGARRLEDPSSLPAERHFVLNPPLELVEGPGSKPHGTLDETVVVTVEALDFRARIEGAPTRLVADADLALPFAAEVITEDDVVLPDTLPAGRLGAAPWDVRVLEPRVIKPGEGDTSPPRRLWELEPMAGEGQAGSWQELWEKEQPTLTFALGTVDPSRAPRIERIAHRQATVSWRIDPWEEHELLSLSVPQWLPAGHAGRQPLPLHQDGFHYVSRVEARLGGLDEHFTVDSSSEIPASRLLLGPDRWTVYDELGHEVAPAEALGELGGHVRWRRFTGKDPGPGLADDSGDALLLPTDWAGGSEPVLIVERPGTNVSRWGALYAPEPVPWHGLRETPARASEGSQDVLLATLPELPALWINLWGFVCRYDRRCLSFARPGHSGQPVTAWIARHGLPLFPRGEGCAGGGQTGSFLLRSLTPIYAVKDQAANTFDFAPALPRPTLRLGQALLGAEMKVFDVGEKTRVRSQVGEAAEVPETFRRGWIPGNRASLEDPIGDRALWLAVEQVTDRTGHHGGFSLAAVGRKRWRGAASGPLSELAPSNGGYLLSWDGRQGWLFRGFFTRPGGMVELGVVRRQLAGKSPQSSPVLLCDGPAGGRLSFRLTIGDEITWSDETPETIRHQVSDDEIFAWEEHHFLDLEHRPPGLRDYEARILSQSPAQVVELTEPGESVDHTLGIRLWEPREGEIDDLVSEIRARHISLTNRDEKPKVLRYAEEDA